MECLAIVWAIDHFYPYVRYNYFHLITDNSALTWLQSFELKGRRGRWIVKLQQYDFTVIHHSGKKNSNADALSRAKITSQ